MSQNEQKTPFKVARAAADKVIVQLSPYCSTIGVVGSVRREKKLVNDIEICCIPFMEKAQLGLFKDSTRRIDKFVIALAKLGLKEKGCFTTGRYVQVKLHGPMGLKADIFIPQEHDFYRQYAIRTGSADYSYKIVATAWTALGWRGTEHGLRREEYCTFDGHAWKWTNREAGQELPPAWKSEMEFFDWIGVKFRRPEYREV